MISIFFFQWRDSENRELASFFFCVFMDLDFVMVHKNAKKELGEYPAILTSRLVNNAYLPLPLPLPLLFPLFRLVIKEEDDLFTRLHVCRFV